MPTPRPEIPENTHHWWNFPFFGSNDDIPSSTTSTMPLERPTELTGAFKSLEATHTAGHDKSISTGFLEPRVGLDLISDKWNEFMNYLSAQFSEMGSQFYGWLPDPTPAWYSDPTTIIAITIGVASLAIIAAIRMR